MSSSVDDEPPSLEENSCLLPSSDSPLHDPTGEAPRYRDGIEDQDIELGSISSPPISIENRTSQVHGENFITGPLNPLCSRYTGPKRSAAPIFYALYQWVKGPQPSRPFKIGPILPQLQNIPIAFLDKYFPGRKQRSWLLIISCLLWIILFRPSCLHQYMAVTYLDTNPPIRLSCVSRLW